MNFLGIGTGELLLILLIVLLVMGPERLPQLIRQWAKVVKTFAQFTRTWQQFNAELNRQLTLEDMVGKQPRPAGKAAPVSPPPAPASEAEENSIAPPDLLQKTAPVAGQPTPADRAAHAAAGDDDLVQQPADLTVVAEEIPHEQ